jgi:hypothetical protein
MTEQKLGSTGLASDYWAYHHVYHGHGDWRLRHECASRLGRCRGLPVRHY